MWTAVLLMSREDFSTSCGELSAIQKLTTLNSAQSGQKPKTARTLGFLPIASETKKIGCSSAGRCSVYRPKQIRAGACRTTRNCARSSTTLVLGVEGVKSRTGATSAKHLKFLIFKLKYKANSDPSVRES